MEWAMLGKRARLYGVAMPGGDVDYVKLGGTVWAFECDPSDGYRSYLNEIKEASKDADVGPFFPKPLATVTVREWSGEDSEGFELVDKSGHVWLTVGTSESSDYYPSYVFDWQPKLAT